MKELFKGIERKKLMSLMEEYAACLEHMKLLLMIWGSETVREGTEDVSMSKGTRETALHSSSPYNQF